MTPERQNEIAYGTGLIIGRIMRAAVILVGIATLVFIVFTSGRNSAISEPPRVTATNVKSHIAHKPIKHRIRQKRISNKNKVVDKPNIPVTRVRSLQEIERVING